MTAPDWFTAALDAPYEDLTVEAGGLRLTGRAWGERGAPLVVLVHGGAAHAGWWHHVGPHLAPGRRVVAVDLSGHGDSDWADGYSFARWAEEVRQVVAAERPARPAWVVGHSMGGMVALTAAATYGEELAGVVCVDPPEEVLRDRDVPTADDLPRRVPRATREEAMARFRVSPEDPACLPFVKEYLARESVRRRADGWSWKFDPTVTTHGRFDRELLRRTRCPVVLVPAERGLINAEEVEEVRRRVGSDVSVRWVADSGHHVMLDQPLALIDALASSLPADAPGGQESSQFLRMMST